MSDSDRKEQHMVIVQEGQQVCKEKNQLLDYFHKLAQAYQVVDPLGTKLIKEEMKRVKQKYTFLESSYED